MALIPVPFMPPQSLYPEAWVGVGGSLDPSRDYYNQDIDGHSRSGEQYIDLRCSWKFQDFFSSV